MRKTVTSIISATALLGASSLALAASPSASDQSQLNSGATAAPSSRTGSQAAPYSNSGSGTSTSRELNSGGASGMTRGSGTSAQVTDQAQVKQQLEQQGYTNVQNVRKDRTGWTAKAKKGGQQVTVNIDSNGQVKTR